MTSLEPFHRNTTRLPILVAGLFTVPFWMLFGFFLNTKNAQIDFTNKEILGLEYLYPLGQTAFQLIDQTLGSPTANPADLEASLNSLKQVEEKIGSEVGTDSHSLFIRGRDHLAPKHLVSLLEQAITKPEPKYLLKPLIHVLGLIQHIGDTSNLILDPDLDSYYMMDITVLMIPKYMSYLIDTGILQNVLPATDWSNRTSLEILLNFEIIPSLHTKTVRAIQEDPNFYGVNPSLAGRLTGPSQELSESLQDLYQVTRAGQDSSILDHKLLKSIAKLNLFWSISHSELNSLLQIRLHSLRTSRLKTSWVALGLWGLSMLLTFYSLKTLRKMQISNEFAFNQFRNMSLSREITLKGALDAIVSIDHKGNITEFNPAAESLFGRDRSAVIGLSLEETIIPDSLKLQHSQGLKKYLNANRNDNISRRIMLSGKHSSGREIPLELSLVATHVPDSEVVFTAFIRDLTDQYRLENEAKLHQSKLVMASRLSSLGEMAGGISHEIKNPLAIIDGHLQNLSSLLKRPDSTQAVLKSIDSMRRSVSRITKIIDGLRAFARSGETDPFERVSPKQIIEKSLELCRSRLESNGIIIKTQLLGQSSLFCRPTQISQVLVNLINNAYDAIETTKDPWIEIELIDEGDYSVISVTDSGPGIPHDIAEKILQPFFTTKPLGKGTGLGLSVSLGIIQSHHGTLMIDSQHPHTRFVIRLPENPPESLKSAA